jgi:hypothetical protein
MEHHRRFRRKAALNRLFLLDLLEPRCLPATSLPGITTVAYDTSTTPPQVEITFTQADISQVGGELPAAWGATSDAKLSYLLNLVDSGSDFEIDQVASDGAVLNQVVGPDNPPAVENVSDVTQNGVAAAQVAIPITGGPLQPGNYQACVEGSTTFAMLFDAVEPGTAWDALSSAFQPLVVGQFAVYSHGASFQNNAYPLPIPGSAVTTITGDLNPDDYQSAVDLYRFTVGPTQGNLWEVGLAVQSQGIGSPLQADLTLFNGETGRVIASALSGTGLPGDPGDPYLFAGLNPGTYYVAVSAAGYLPYGPSGYNPELGTAGVLGLHQPGGPFPFELSIAAVPHPHPTTVTSSRANWLDPLSSSPTSLTLSFSGPINLSNLFVVDQAEGALELVDSANNVWPITAEKYDINQHQLTMIVDDPLPAGTYRLISPSDDALTDLAGVPVVAPGEPPELLATFSVAASGGQTIPGDLGAIWPNQIGISPASIGDTFGGSAALAPGQAVTYRFVAVVTGLYKIQTVVDSGSISVQEFGSFGMSTLDAGGANHINNYITKLVDGVYQIRFANVGNQPAQFAWRLKIGSVDWEKIIGNGAGQSAAFALSLLSTTTVDQTPSSEPSFQGATVTFQVPSAGGGPSGPLPSSLFVSLNTSLMGQPGAAGSAIASVGPSVDGASVAVADSAQGLMPNIRYVSTDQAESGQEIDGLLARAPDRPPARAKTDNLGLAANRPSPDAASILADERALVQGEWLIRLAGMFRDWLGPTTADPHQSPAEFAPGQSVILARAAFEREEKGVGSSPAPRVFEKTAHADAQLPAGLLVIAVAGSRLHDPVRRWWRRRPTSRGKGHRGFGPPYPSPHVPSFFARATTRARH